MCDSKVAEFEPPGLAKIFFSDIQSITLNYHTPSHMSIIINNNIIIIIGSLPPRCSTLLDPSLVLTVIVVLIVIAFKIIIKQYLQLDYWDEAGA